MSTQGARQRLATVGPNETGAADRASDLVEFARFFANPLVLILLLASAVSAVTGERLSAASVATIVILNAFQTTAPGKRPSACAIPSPRRRGRGGTAAGLPSRAGKWYPAICSASAPAT